MDSNKIKITSRKTDDTLNYQDIGNNRQIPGTM